MLLIKRIYEKPAHNDGYRVLVDRLWPRGLSKEKAALDLWLKDIAPSAALRTWFDHDPKRFAEFTVRYQQELEHNPAIERLRQVMKDNSAVTILYAAHDPEVNHAQVLLNFMLHKVP